MFFITVGQEHERSNGMSLKGREEDVVLKCGKMIMDENTVPGRVSSGVTGLLDVKWLVGSLKALGFGDPGSSVFEPGRHHDETLELEITDCVELWLLN